MMTDASVSRDMRGGIKRFDKNLHALTDKKGKTAFLSYLDTIYLASGHRNIENPNRYGIDVLTLNSDDQVVNAWEIEVRLCNWVGDLPFRYSSMNCLERKEYMWRKTKEFVDKIPFKVHNDCKVTYVQLNNLCNRAAMVDGDVILEYPRVRTVNKFRTEEYVRKVPINRVTQIKLGESNV